MRAGRLRHRISLQQRDPDPPAQSADGGRVDAWSTVLDNEPAEVRQLRGRELEGQGQALAEVSTRIRIRNHPSVAIAADWRVLHGSTVYSIIHVIGADLKGRDLELMCRALL